MAYFLCIETSTEVCSVAIGSENGVMVSSDYAKGNSHSETITIQIEDCLQQSGLKFEDLDAIGITNGPGSYTGLRVGTSVAKGICYALDIPLIALDTLYGIAFGTRQYAEEGDVIIPMIDARRMEVYTAIYDDNLNLHTEINNLIIEENLFSYLSANRAILCGNGSHKCTGVNLGVDTLIIPTQCSASHLIFNCAEKFNSREFQDVAYYSPFYLKSPNITKSKKNIL